MKYWIANAFLVLTVLLGANGAVAQSPTVESSAPSTQLQPGDIIRVNIWREPDLSGDFVVDASGIVTLPLLGNISTVGMSPSDLVDSLMTEFRTQIRSPSITIFPLRQVFLLGDVLRPGVYTVPPSTTLAGAVALAGGPSPIGDLDKLSVIRDGSSIVSGISMEDAIHIADLRSGDQIYVGRISWVERNATYVLGAAFTLVGLLMPFLN